jgi:hypothetical protein
MHALMGRLRLSVAMGDTTARARLDGRVQTAPSDLKRPRVR